MTREEQLAVWNKYRQIVFKGKPLTQNQDINPIGLFDKNLSWNRNEALDYIDKMINIINDTPENEFN